ncbi:MAG: inositol monophosphatase family protein [Candidatus Aenigmarchaeota archaeon]|nr:inositol monophosphatase family protein [Candidatus Aenigmarchaeota archaeon]
MKELLMEIVRDTGKLLLENFEKIKPAEILERKAYDYSIVADKLAEDNILTKLKEAGVKCKVVSEESGQINLGDSGKVLFIDPLDGTLNYSVGIPHFCISIALQKANEVILGIVYDPSREELFLAEKNKGAFLNNKRIEVSKNRDLRNSFCAVAFNYRDFKRSLLVEEKIRKVIRRVRNFGSAAIDFSWVACGRLQGFVDMNLSPWDMAAGALLVEEAGGKVTDFKGNNWHPYSKEILATNGIIHGELLRIIGEE